MSKISSVTFKGKSGKSYDLDVYKLEGTWKEVAGVYVITRRYKKQDGTWTHDVKYIGETENLGERMSGHHKQACFDKENANALCWHAEANGKTRLNIEADLLGNRNPPCND